jgi:hypothetical protein
MKIRNLGKMGGKQLLRKTLPEVNVVRMKKEVEVSFSIPGK